MPRLFGSIIFGDIKRLRREKREFYGGLLEKLWRKKQPPFILLENVDRLLKSPAKQRGRDFGIILACLRDEGYTVEWRVINAAEYGYQQRRRRTFIFAYRNDTKYAEDVADAIQYINKSKLEEKQTKYEPSFGS